MGEEPSIGTPSSVRQIVSELAADFEATPVDTIEELVTGSFGELAEDLTQHHHHFICSSCGAVEDFTLPKDLERAVETALTRAARRRQFLGSHHRLDLLGVCSACG